MQKKTVIVIASVGALLVGVAGGYLSTHSVKQLDNKDEVKSDLTYQDESGFSFGYPKGIKVKDVTPDDGIYYSKLDLIKGKDVLTISVLDVKGEPSFKDSTLVGATSLAGISAKQYANQGKLITLAIDNGVLYLIEGLKDKGYWEGVQNIVVSSFALVEDVSTSGSGSAAVDNAVYEEEETIE